VAVTMGRITVLGTGERLVGRGVRAFDPVIRELVQSARQEIQLAIYRFDESATSFLNLLKQAAARGVRVLVIVSALSAQPPGIRAQLARLQEAGMQVVDFAASTGGFLHAKAIVADRKRAVIGSANLTWGGLAQNHEPGVLIEGVEAWEIAHLLDGLAQP